MSRYGVDRDANNIYYPGTSIPRNYLDIKDQNTLSYIENEILIKTISYFVKMVDENTIFDYSFLKLIHKTLFEKLYEFAGAERNLDVHKGETSFCRAIYIQSFSESIFLELKREKYLLNYADKKAIDFAERLAYYMSEINMLHPFWEGNGRTLRLFIDLIAYVNGYSLIDYPDNDYEFLDAAIYSVSFDHSKFRDLIYKGMKKRKD